MNNDLMSEIETMLNEYTYDEWLEMMSDKPTKPNYDKVAAMNDARKRFAWIPCEKCLPPVKQYVLCWIWDDYYIGYLEPDECEWHFEEFDLRKDDDNFDDVAAWMPLPEPYKRKD